MSNLNYDLKKHHLTADPACTCGYPYETAEHYLQYPQYPPFVIAIPTSTLYFEEILTSNNKKMKIYLPLFMNSSIKPVDFN